MSKPSLPSDYAVLLREIADFSPPAVAKLPPPPKLPQAVAESPLLRKVPHCGTNPRLPPYSLSPGRTTSS
jgi:hypothetical protein